MRFSFTDDQRLFAAGLRDLLLKECPPSAVRAAWNDGTGHSPALWKHLDEMGVIGLLAPEAAGGLGGDDIDAVLLWQELGRAAAPGPVIEHMVAAPLVAAAGVEASIVTVAPDVGGYVPHATVADAILTPAGVLTDYTAVPVESLDGGRLLCAVTGGSVVGGSPAAGANGVNSAAVADRLALASAAYLVGLGERMLYIAGEYARQREQFGRPIGSFQAVKHLMANALLGVEFAKAPVYRAAWSLATGATTAQRDVSMAKALANEAAYAASRNAMQVHGGIGYTWEADLQLFMKKTWALMRASGDTSFHRRRVAAHVLGVAAG
jgi:alkylation response protein AidB-like acyl-CoA dehydrogenase